MMKKYLIFAAMSGMIAVVLGAFGAHGLKEVLSPEKLNSFSTGVRYQMMHSLLLILVGSISLISAKAKKTTALFLVIGMIAFSGSIYLLTLGWIPSKYFWFVTPLGGLFLILAWCVLLFSLVKSKVAD